MLRHVETDCARCFCDVMGGCQLRHAKHFVNHRPVGKSKKLVFGWSVSSDRICSARGKPPNYWIGQGLVYHEASKVKQQSPVFVLPRPQNANEGATCK